MVRCLAGWTDSTRPGCTLIPSFHPSACLAKVQRKLQGRLSRWPSTWKERRFLGTWQQGTDSRIVQEERGGAAVLLTPWGDAGSPGGQALAAVLVGPPATPLLFTDSSAYEPPSWRSSGWPGRQSPEEASFPILHHSVLRSPVRL